jgi:hypothetical protein
VVGDAAGRRRLPDGPASEPARDHRFLTARRPPARVTVPRHRRARARAGRLWRRGGAGSPSARDRSGVHDRAKGGPNCARSLSQDARQRSRYARGVSELVFPDPPLRARGILLRPWGVADVPAIVAACQDPTMPMYMPHIPRPYSDVDAISWMDSQEPNRLAGTRLELAIADSADERLLGAIGASNVDMSSARPASATGLHPRPAATGTPPARCECSPGGCLTCSD